MLSPEELEKSLYEDYLYRAMMNGEVWVIADEMYRLMTLAYREGYREAIKGMAEG